ncbi:hypothetical protein [Novosphingobium sp. Gsoil 351]|uniref:hypothetical protein n=1 Tax=Novosphingobium sp. Gsoil 351 TaxID=2675225 RepID=UPI0012B5003D|nr:hypothetical protein [Novosphingobium sp. Gsoil 351]QGN55184.1 hypothetical protein GKE62_12165 [Novosphingobium sp. Gsoil 351]
MRIRNTFAAAAGFFATAAPALARATAPLEGASEMGGMSTLLIVALVVALGVGIFLIVDDNNKPDSP